MAWRTPPVGADVTSFDERRELCGMTSPAGSLDDIDEHLERRDVERDRLPIGELFARTQLYGERTRSGSVTPLGANRCPINDADAAA